MRPLLEERLLRREVRRLPGGPDVGMDGRGEEAADSCVAATRRTLRSRRAVSDDARRRATSKSTSRTRPTSFSRVIVLARTGQPAPRAGRPGRPCRRLTRPARRPRPRSDVACGDLDAHLVATRDLARAGARPRLRGRPCRRSRSRRARARARARGAAQQLAERQQDERDESGRRAFLAAAARRRVAAHAAEGRDRRVGQRMLDRRRPARPPACRRSPRSGRVRGTSSAPRGFRPIGPITNRSIFTRRILSARNLLQPIHAPLTKQTNGLLSRARRRRLFAFGRTTVYYKTLS